MIDYSVYLEQAVYIRPLVAIIMGFFVGSYLNVVALRWGRQGIKGSNHLKSRSECPQCHHLLIWHDLIPILGFVLLRGKCRYCRKPISWRYLIIEILTGLIFGLIIAKYGVNANAISLLILASIMITIGLIDLRLQIIPDQLTIIPIVLTAIYLLLTRQKNLIYQLHHDTNLWFFGFLIGVGLITFIVALTKGGGMGIGDVKLAGLMGITLGTVGTLIALMIAFISGGIIAAGLLMTKKATLKTAIPFGPLLIFGWLVTILWLEPIIAWYN